MMKSSSVAGAAAALRCCCMPPPLATCRELAESVLPRESICVRQGVGKSNAFQLFIQLLQLFSAAFLTIFAAHNFCFACVLLSPLLLSVVSPGGRLVTVAITVTVAWQPSKQHSADKAVPTLHCTAARLRQQLLLAVKMTHANAVLNSRFGLQLALLSPSRSFPVL